MRPTRVNEFGDTVVLTPKQAAEQDEAIRRRESTNAVIRSRYDRKDERYWENFWGRRDGIVTPGRA